MERGKNRGYCSNLQGDRCNFGDPEYIGAMEFRACKFRLLRAFPINNMRHDRHFRGE